MEKGKRILKRIVEIVLLLLAIFIAFNGFGEYLMYKGHETFFRTIFISTGLLMIVKYIVYFKKPKYMKNIFVYIKQEYLSYFLSIGVFQACYCLLLTFVTPEFFFNVFLLVFTSMLIAVGFNQLKHIQAGLTGKWGFK